MATQSQHKYEYEIDIEDNSTGARIVRLIGKNKRVLELGAGPGSITKHLKTSGHCSIVAIENDSMAIDKLSTYCENIYNLDLNDANWHKALADEEKFDIVLAADVLEHLYDPWAVLNTMKKLLKDDGSIIVSLPHVGHNIILACILESDFEYRDWGLLDRTHIRFFAMKNIQGLFESAKLRIGEAQFVVIPPELTEFENRWRKLPGHLRHALSSNKYGHVYQVIVKTLPQRDPSKGIHLSSLTGAAAKEDVMNRIKSLVNIYLPNPIRDKLRKFVHKLRK